MSVTDATLPDPRTTPTVDVEHAGRILGVSRPTAYVMVHNGSLPVLRCGRRIRVPVAGLWRMVGMEPPITDEELSNG